ncbi:MAG: hypothetical protein WC617_08910 [Rhodanobacter sp.]|jgi:hypothetical protein
MIFVKKMATALIVLGLSAASLSGCHRTPDEVQVRQAIGVMTAAAEAGSATDLVAPLSADFDGNGGELDPRSLGNMMRLLSLRGEHVGVVMGPVTIEHRGERMLARFTVTLSRGGSLLPDQLGMYEVESAWREEDGRWRCYIASWKHAI